MSDDRPLHVTDKLTLALAGLNWDDDHKKNSSTSGTWSHNTRPHHHPHPHLSRLEHEINLPDNGRLQDEEVNITPLLSSCQRQQEQQHQYSREDSLVSSTTSPASSDSELAPSYDDHLMFPSTTSILINNPPHQLHEPTRHPRLLASNISTNNNNDDDVSDNNHSSSGIVEVPGTTTSRHIQWAHPLPDTKSTSEANQSVTDATNADVPSTKRQQHVKAVYTNEFEPDKHFYPRVLNAGIHPLVGSFFSLGNERILHRYIHLNPNVDTVTLRRALTYRPKYFMWGGADLFNVTTADGKRQMIIVETNSCPSGQKSMPLLDESDELGGYGTVIRTAFRHLIACSTDETSLATSSSSSMSSRLHTIFPSTTSRMNMANSDYYNHTTDTSIKGDLAVVFDKNPMEASGYAAAMADVYNERVWLVEYLETDIDPPVRWTEDAVMEIRDEDNEWHPIRSCFRYVTQRPWARIPLRTRTQILNSTLVCLAGGRNKQIAALAYEFLNAELSGTGLQVRTPITKRNVTLEEIPLLMKSFGGHGVIKVPYSNAGQGVYTITNEEELAAFMSLPHKYQKFIVQSLVGNASWSSQTREGRFYHVGTVPNRKNHTFASDLRVMIAGDESGFRPIAIYGRRARRPLLRHLSDNSEVTSWEMLGTNLSVKLPDGIWTTESSRLVLMDRKDFNQLGVGLDDLIDAYVQTALSVMAIDMMCQRLVRTEDGTFNFDLFRALNPDEVLLNEIKH